MKELKFNIQYLLKKKEFYLAMLIAFFINLIHVFLCVSESVRLNYTIEGSYSGEYQFILYNAFVTLNVLIIVIFPIAFSMIFSDSNWLENKRKTSNMLFTRLNFKKNILIRALLSIVVTFFISFFSFLFNYIVLRIIYGTGNALTFWQSTAFYLDLDMGWFLDNVRLSNPVLFVMIINISVSLMLGLLSAFSYLVSFFAKQRILIYFIPLIFLIITELILPNIGFKSLSFIKFLQPFSKYNIADFIMGALILLFINISLLCIRAFKKDVLV